MRAPFPPSFSGLLAADPAAQLLQVTVLLIAPLLLFLLFWTLKDVMQRSRSFWVQSGSILLVTVIPFYGFLAYLLFRPTQTLKEKELLDAVRALTRHQNAKPAAKKTKAE